ncbi:MULTISPECIES: hypothetical protein [Bacillus cereus group]|uniref:hypothetical protein n=1 Tax=Bacillus cereus group TaxID=86661 RepID=UPI000CD95F24|nr:MULTISPECIES: hypothetical protein [Bacillus cereus group]MBG9832112.1 hypothetical protein [Bacillus wiedmannii]MED3079413.1 hypothetical protein [Bacillus wiedmannii]UOB98481.1 hypothetical protein BTI679_58800 [Bacillus wiedmannii]
MIVAYVDSEANHQKGQKHRSSENFNVIKQNPIGTTGIQVCITSSAKSDDDLITFDIMRDKKGTDPVLYENVHDGRILPDVSFENCYVANPKGANSEFTVTMFALGNFEEER